MTHQFQPGDVAASEHAGISIVVDRCDRHFAKGPHWHHMGGGWDQLDDALSRGKFRLLVVIDPEDSDAVERLWRMAETTPAAFADALREFAAPKPPRPPADVAAVVTDRRENTWRLLADGDWVCTSGPDHGEYLNWDRLAAERGPLEVQS